MIRSYWNALRVGDSVIVHDDADPDFAVSPGVVTGVHGTHAAKRVSVRLSGARGAGRLVAPKRLAVHLATDDATGDCWRCDSSASSIAS